MPVVSQQQNAAMHAAASGNSTLGIPASVGKEFVNASHGQNVSALPQRALTSPLEAMTGMPSGKTHRGKRSRGNGPKNAPPGLAKAQQHASDVSSAMASGNHAQAKTSALHLANALHAFQKKAAPSPNTSASLSTPALPPSLGAQ
jgi:hypothetical protein